MLWPLLLVLWGWNAGCRLCSTGLACTAQTMGVAIPAESLCHNHCVGSGFATQPDNKYFQNAKHRYEVRWDSNRG